jgi:hypothetical protein
MSYTIGTGYYDHPTSASLFKMWMANTKRFSQPSDIVVVNAAGRSREADGGTWLNMRRNYGLALKLEKGEKYCGWWLSFMLSALVAYHNGDDFIYKEQDCLAFGPWVDRLYTDAVRANTAAVVGQLKHEYQVEISLVLVRRRSVLMLIDRYLSIPDTDFELRPELKFLYIMKNQPNLVSYMTMGCGRNRPIPYDASCFYAQKITEQELSELSSRGLL